MTRIIQRNDRIGWEAGGTLPTGMSDQENCVWRCHGGPFDFRRNRLHGRSLAQAVMAGIEWVHEERCELRSDWVY